MSEDDDRQGNERRPHTPAAEQLDQALATLAAMLDKQREGLDKQREGLDKQRVGLDKQRERRNRPAEAPSSTPGAEPRKESIPLLRDVVIPGEAGAAGNPADAPRVTSQLGTRIEALGDIGPGNIGPEATGAGGVGLGKGGRGSAPEAPESTPARAGHEGSIEGSSPAAAPEGSIPDGIRDQGSLTEDEACREMIERLTSEIEVIVQGGVEEALREANERIVARVKQHVDIMLPEILEEIARMKAWRDR